MGRYKTTTKDLLEMLIPTDNSWYGRPKQNIIQKIVHEKGLKPNTVRNAFHRAIKNRLIVIEAGDVPRLTKKGHSVIAPFVSKDLPGSVLLVIFDIAEADRFKRTHLRRLLRELGFKQIQKSVWASTKDHRHYLQAEIKALDLGNSVIVYEAKQL